ncbi:1,3-beta-galactosyl-N-acetylhexosamine phosphorylase [Paenibacillus tianjinensis]|uniref:1,3-beta-galactosyl-N-acetylhexosamine phosphorylase n=1 Tax=Paenibacillus tianjinensis TaxID=2810347 RepID=A0ABX7LBW7_9BACL|nr:1,3-beta-galactosyl-N-acetylhexosamine phosphorylase [Paenibacillus tianjinensis]QSF45642.1 1,3-beta-galactosyl-N-acetylhexosamine phosphorylase [Paenibacillus tianjinensis]
MAKPTKGAFTLPGESGYEALTLELAERWGADVIRDSDGTKLSDEIIHAGYGIYSTICIIRDHNEWASQNLDKLQQCFLITNPKVAVQDYLSVYLMEDFFTEQFRVNDSKEAFKYWQVIDRTTGEEVPREQWNYDRESGNVVLTGIVPWHKYTVSFMAYRIWEEISMYNHTTNNWDKEHLMQIDPMYPETQAYILEWMEYWCGEHKETTVVRFTSLFYNFAWIWGSSERNRHLFSDWGSYDFTVSARALDLFAKKAGYPLTAEDFVNGGKYRVSHIPAEQRKLDWMAFINDFVIGFSKQLIDIVHKHGKLAYVFYDDSWVGMEPYNDRFGEFGFDGMIKCVFSGYEARMCSGVKVDTHEIRLHPYLFPVGLGGAPTFMEGGDPTLDAKKYWINIRRALLREPIDRIGLGGYLHLVEPYPDFCDYIEKIADEFREIKELHQQGKPYLIKTKVAVLHSWGKLRSWTLSGHFHETFMHDLIHINEALSGSPVEVQFIDFEDIRQGVLQKVDVVINAGAAGSAWSGGRHWEDSKVVDLLTKWVYEGGTFIGVNQPSAVEGYDTYFRMAHVLGVDEDTGARVVHGRWAFEAKDELGLLPEGASIEAKQGIYLTDGAASVVQQSGGRITLSTNTFGKGKGIYFPSFEFNLENTRLLLNLIRYAGNELQDNKYITDNLYTECAYYPESKTLVVINNSAEPQKTSVETEYGLQTLELAPFDTVITTLK